jgi:hypothetical protein
MSKDKEKDRNQSVNQKIMERLNKYNKDGRGTEKTKGESK